MRPRIQSTFCMGVLAGSSSASTLKIIRENTVTYFIKKNLFSNKIISVIKTKKK